jgi:hypothetical protein
MHTMLHVVLNFSPAYQSMIKYLEAYIPLDQGPVVKAFEW